MLQPLVATEEDFVEVSVTEAVKVAAEDAAVVKRIRLASLFIFKDLLTSCLALVAPGAGEDLQLSLCSTLTQLLAAARGAVAEEMADPDNGMKLPLSHLVFSEHVEQCGASQKQPLLLRASKGGVAVQYNLQQLEVGAEADLDSLVVQYNQHVC